ncbi:Nonribosomal peptide synthetase 5 [Cladobotryum mycophilum]|uniref:Nonribosomal peptide synthetase 5 n=1 Tax=Cladobotryum mycophilum TaxID=491253 RepID=A0ABR0SAI1_9HYPO
MATVNDDQPSFQAVGGSSWFNFWQVSTLDNTYAKCDELEEALGKEGVLRTSFPLVFLQNGHGQEPKELQSLMIPITPDSTHLDAVWLAKDARRRERGDQQPRGSEPVEISFSFVKSHQQPGSYETGEEHLKVSQSEQRRALIEVEASDRDGQILLSVAFHRDMQHQGRLRDWFQTLKKTLQTVVQDLRNAPVSFVPEDFPLLSLSNHGLDTLLTEQLPSMGIKPDAVADLCPCSPLQEGVLLSSSSYAVYWVWQCVPHDGNPISPSRLAAAWKEAAG